VLTQLAETTRDPEIAKTLLRIASEHTVCADEAERTLALARTTNKDHQQSAFDPEDIERLSRAYEDALRTLELPDRNDPITQIICTADHRSGQNRRSRSGKALRFGG
jgi:hypothetical protein